MMKKADIERLFRTNYPDMHRVAFMMLGDQDEAHDIVQDVFAAIIEGDYSESITGHYLIRSVRNRCLNHLRDMSVAQRLRGLYAIESGNISDPDDFVWMETDLIDRISSIISNNLSDSCRKVLVLRYSEGLSYKEIADNLNLSLSGVYKHLRHALDVLRHKLHNSNG